MPFQFTCGQCGVWFTRPTQAAGTTSVYCSRSCYWQSMRKPVAHRTCRACGETFDPRVGGGKKPNLTRDHCNRECYDVGRVDVLKRWVATQNGPGCWAWPHGLNKDGYGVTSHGKTQRLVHRAAWALLVGPIPDGLTLDHMCHNSDPDCEGGRTCLHRRCANPAHLVVAERVENTLRGKNNWAVNARKTHCIHGHPLSGPNLYVNPRGQRQCRTCQAARERRYRDKLRARRNG